MQGALSLAVLLCIACASCSLDAAPEVLDFVDEGAGRELGGCEKVAQTHNIFTRAVKRWQLRRVKKNLNRSQRNIANNVFYKVQALAFSQRAKHAIKDKCVEDFYRRAIYRHEARHLVAKAILNGQRRSVKSKGKLRPALDRFKCEKAMFRAVRPLWKEGKQLKYHRELCAKMKEEWTSKLEVSAKAVKSIMKLGHCDKHSWMGRMRRAEYMVEGVNAICKHFKRGSRYRTEGRHKRKLRAWIRHRVAAYAVASLQTNGRERYQNSLQYLRQDPVYKRASNLLIRRKKEMDAVANVG